MATSANSRAAYVHIYSLMAARQTPYVKKFFNCTRSAGEKESSTVPRMTAKMDAKRPNVNANGAASIIAWLFMSWIYSI